MSGERFLDQSVEIKEREGGRKVVVTGMDAITPLGFSWKETWGNLVKGVNTAITLFDERFRGRVASPIVFFDPDKFFSSNERRIKTRSSRAAQFSYIAARGALADARLLCDEHSSEVEIDYDRWGVYVGTGTGGVEEYRRAAKIVESEGPRKIPAQTVFKVLPERVGTVLNLAFGFRGRSGTTITACATGLTNIAQSAEYVANGKMDGMISGGTEGTISDVIMAGFANIGVLPSKFTDRPQIASRPFDEESEGFVPSEGAGIVVLENEEIALSRDADIKAELAGFAWNNDAKHESLPDHNGLARAIILALEMANLKTTDVDVYVAHGTSTGLNELSEMKALVQALGKHAYKVAITAPKSMLNHQLGAAGALTSLVAISILKHDVIPPTINIGMLKKDFAKFDIVQKVRDVKANVVVAAAAGFGGHNAVAVFKRYFNPQLRLPFSSLTT